MTIMVQSISPILYLFLIICFSMFESIYSTKIRDKTLEVPSIMPGVSTKEQSNWRVKLIVESEIVFLLEFNR